MRVRIYRHLEADLHRRRDLEDVDAHYTEAWFRNLRDHGFNGLWLSVWMRQLVTFRDVDAAEQIHNQEALNRLIERSARHDVGVYLFLNEPRAFSRSDPIWERFPDLRGAPGTWPHEPYETYLVCTSTAMGRDYVYENARRLHRVVPGLAGTIHINAAEYPTHCYCHTITNPNGKIFASNQEHEGIACPRCAARRPEEVVSEILNLYHRGCRDAGSQAAVIAWNWDWIMYAPYPQSDLIRRLDPDIRLMADFECGGKVQRYGRERPVDEYSLIFVGPGRGYELATECARRHGNPVLAKLQVGATHELATVANMPLVGNLYRKLDYLYRAGCEGFLGSWTFACRFTMNTAAIALFLKKPGMSREVFLADLCRTYFGAEDTARFVSAIDGIEAAFEHYPITNPMLHRGPLNYAPAYPLDGTPLQQKPLPPNYDRGEFGDAWEQCLGPYSLEDVGWGFTRMAADLRPAVEELERVLFPSRSPWQTDLIRYAGPPVIPNENDRWSAEEQAALMESLLPSEALDALPELRGVRGLRRLQEWCNAGYLLGSMECAERLFKNYQARRDGRPDDPAWLRRMQAEERETVARCLALCRLDARLGFHGECQKYLVTVPMLAQKIEALGNQCQT